MHLKKTKKTPRMIRMIALMLSLVLVFFTMTGMALAEEGTDVPDAAPDSTLEIVEAELELEPVPTEEPPAETPGAEETPEPAPEPEEPSIPPEPTDTPAPALEPDYALDAEIPSGWHNAPVTITVRLIDKNNTGWVKIEVAFSNDDGADRFDVTEEWNEYGYLERTMLDNGTVYFFVTDPMGIEHELPLDVYCMDFEAPVLRAGINGTLLRVEASDTLSGIAAVFVNDELYTTLDNGVLNIHIGGMTEDKYMYVQALDNAGNRTDYLVLANPCYEKPTPAPTPTPSPTPSTDENKKHDAHCPAGCDCRKNGPSSSSSGNSSGGGSTPSGSGGGSKSAGSSAQAPASSETPAPTTEPITKEDGTSFTQNGNSVTRDLLYDKYSNKQFITVETRNGETFYLVIDYDKPLDEDGERYETYFLNLVDEADLLALVEGDKQTPVCTCTTKCEAGAVNTSCEVCKTNMTECTGKEKLVEKVPDTPPEPEVEPEPEKKSSGGTVALLLLLLLGGGGALYWFKFRKKKPDAKGPVDLDDYDYGEEDYGEEYETEPDEAETTDTTQDAE
jgi:putative uncharacterized protein (fragment)